MVREHGNWLRWLYSPFTILTVALFLRLVWILAYAPWENDFERLIANPPNSDSGSYHKAALAILHNWSRPGKTLEEMPEVAEAVSIRSPGYPLLIALVYAVTGGRVVGVVWAQLLFSVWGCYLAIAALRKLFGERGGALGGWFYALNPTLIDYVCLVLTETLFVWAATLTVSA